MRQLAPLILIVLAIAGSFFYTKPLYANIQRLLADKAQYEDALEKARELDVEITKLNNIKNSFSGEDLDRLHVMIPQNIDTIRLVIEINEIAKKYSTGVKSIRITNTADLQSTTKTPQKQNDNAFALSFSIATSYDRFTDFLKDLESNLRLADVTGLTFSPNDTDSLYTFNLTIKTYWAK